jgi:glycosyltransferase involved in cell wall biosynthesis
MQQQQTNKTISIVTACYNEELNVEDIYLSVRAVMSAIGRYRYEHIFIDNCSSDNTVAILKRLAASDSNIKIIVNARNFGPVRSSTHALTQARGDAIISIVADFQDPPALIPTLIEGWEAGAYAVIGIKRSSEENSLFFFLRRQYYKLVERVSSIDTIQNFTGFGLYDRRIMDKIREFDDPHPFFRGMIAEIGLPIKKIPYDQPQRKRGFSKHNWYALYDIGMLGIINNSRVPLRLATFAGFAGALLAFLVALVYLFLKLAFWNTFSFGLAPLLIGVFFTASLQLVFLGILGEYVGAIYTQVQKRPYVVELERVNFDSPPALPIQVQPTEVQSAQPVREPLFP